MQRIKAFVAVLLAALLSITATAHAALPTEATAAFTALDANVDDVVAAVWPILALVTGAFVLMKLFKKGINKAT